LNKYQWRSPSALPEKKLALRARLSPPLQSRKYEWLEGKNDESI
jgi:hypothetical protein